MPRRFAFALALALLLPAAPAWPQASQPAEFDASAIPWQQFSFVQRASTKAEEERALNLRAWVRDVLAAPAKVIPPSLIRADGPRGNKHPVAADAFTLDDWALIARQLHRYSGGVAPKDRTQQIGYAFILAAGGVDRDAQLNALLDLSTKDEDSRLQVYWLLKKLPGHKVGLRKYLLTQISAEGNDVPSRFAALALGTIPAGEDLPAMLEILQRKTIHASVVSGLLASLNTEPRTVTFDQLAPIAPQALRCPNPDPTDWSSPVAACVQLLLKVDRARAVPLLHELRQKHPRQAATILGILAEHGDADAAAPLAELYNAAPSDEQAGYAAEAISHLRDPAVYRTLRYRPGLLPAVVHQTLAPLRRCLESGATPPSEAFSYVEAYYLKQIRGVAAYEHLAITEAFAAAGDPRALPYLREIAAVTQRTADAEWAIQHLQRGEREKVEARK